MKVFYRDEKTGIEAGVNDFGELFLGDDNSGYNLPDTPENREYIRREFIRYTIERRDEDVQTQEAENADAGQSE